LICGKTIKKNTIQNKKDIRMTLILCLGNQDQFIQISDRRLTSNGKIIDDESNKAGVVICEDARVGFGFTGLAKSGSFETNFWLTDSIINKNKNFKIVELLIYLRDELNNAFQTFPSLSNLSQNERKLGIIFSGYLYNRFPPLAVCAIISNYIGKAKESNRFEIIPFNEKRPLSYEFTFIQRIGTYEAMVSKDEEILRNFLKERKPAKAIVEEALKIFWEMANRPQARELIGSRLSSIVIPRDFNKPVKAGYHPDILKTEYYLPNCIMLLKNSHVAMQGITFKAIGPNKKPVAYQKWPKNKLCPCGSGKKYKYCHGKRK
jgi:hypothetical protein